MIWVVLIVAVLVVFAGLGVTGRLPGTSRGRSARRPSGSGRPAGRGGGTARPASRPRQDTGRDRGTTRGPGGGRPPGAGTRAPGRSASGGSSGVRGTATQAGPRPGEIWWADVPYEDGPGHKVRPCVVLRTYRGGAEVLKITSQDRSDRSDHVEIPTRTWDPDADHNSFLDLTGPVRVPVADFQDKAGTLDARVWRQVCRLHEISPN
ncbi:type II toxin-antitoxin system PemK/MazF family toxin [Microbispora sp. NPDC088329]|uniref:type II toxin-antitoxin system PemK/MazF family toxin n=1 Tax=Microbispora sp. NPDC088329 TaxID=3154869 RepID=UPI00341A6879